MVTQVLHVYENPAEFIESVAQRTAELLRPMVEQASAPAPDNRPLTKKEAARYLGVSLSTFTTRENEGIIKGFRSGAKRLYRREDLDASLKPVRRTAA